jgi:hypothetical protein
VDPIQNVAQVMEVLRRKMFENLETLRTSGRLPLAAGSGAGTTRLKSPADLRKNVMRRVGSISESDPAFEQKTAMLFVESVLLDQFGEGLVNVPAFRQLVEDVCNTMSEDEAIAADLRALIADVRKH